MSKPLMCRGCGQPVPAHQTPKEAAAALGLGERSIRRLLALGEIKGFRVGRQWRICQPSVRDYLDRCMERASA